MKHHLLYRLLMTCFCLLLTACVGEANYAPVTDISQLEAIPTSGSHTVRHGETLYEIAWRYGLDYRDLAALNHLHSPYVLHTGQVIRLRQSALRPAQPITVEREQEIAPPRVVTDSAPVSSQEVQEPHISSTGWIWPAKGAVGATFSALHKGINIYGQEGAPIYATSSGTVVYAGDGLRGYGNLIILKHNNIYLSAYAHNAKILVREGGWVKQGQKIAEMGNTGTDRVTLHFEIRQKGRPINPLVLLPKNN